MKKQSEADKHPSGQNNLHVNLKRTSRYYYLRLRRLQGSPRSLALAVGIGAAIGITPTFPLHTIFILGAALIIRFNPIAGLIGATIVSNPLTFLPQYYFSWWLGDKILPHKLQWQQIDLLLYHLKHEGLLHSLIALAEIGLSAFAVMMTGGILMAIPTGLAAYYLSLQFFHAVAQKRRQKQSLNDR